MSWWCGDLGQCDLVLGISSLLHTVDGLFAGNPLISVEFLLRERSFVDGTEMVFSETNYGMLIFRLLLLGPSLQENAMATDENAVAHRAAGGENTVDHHRKNHLNSDDMDLSGEDHVPKVQPRPAIFACLCLQPRPPA